jgi:rhamnosyltransferase
MCNRTIDILLGTFCGGKYLAPQLDSLLKQDFSHLDIYVRDEGSQDRSLQIIMNFKLNRKTKNCG